jgi:hypothetical protein
MTANVLQQAAINFTLKVKQQKIISMAPHFSSFLITSLCCEFRI